MFCEKLGVKHELIAPSSPQQNGVAKRKNRTLVKKGRSMLMAVQLPTKFLPKAVSTTGYLSNIPPTKAI